MAIDPDRIEALVASVDQAAETARAAVASQQEERHERKKSDLILKVGTALAVVLSALVLVATVAAFRSSQENGRILENVEHTTAILNCAISVPQTHPEYRTLTPQQQADLLNDCIAKETK